MTSSPLSREAGLVRALLSDLHRLVRGKSANSVALLNLLSTLIVSIINFLTIPLFTRLLGTEGYGIVSVYTTWAQVLMVVVGVQAVGTLASAQSSLPDHEQDAYQASVLQIAGVTTIALALVAVAWLPELSELLKLGEPVVLLVIVQSVGMYVANFFTMRFTLRREAQKSLVLSVSLAVLSVAASLMLVVMVYTGDNAYFGRILGMAVPYAVVGSLLYLRLTAANLKKLSLKYWTFGLPLCLPLVFHGLSQIVLAHTDKIMLQRFSTQSAVGVYTIAFTVSHLLLVLWTALNNTWVPFYYEDLRGEAHEVLISRFRNYMILFTSITAAFMLVAPEIVKVVSPPEFWGAIPVLPPLIMGGYFMFLYSFPVNYEFYVRKTLPIAIGTSCAAIANIALNWVLTPRYGMLGTALATMTSYAALFVFHHVIVTVRYRYRQFPLGAYGGGIAAALLSAAAMYAWADLTVIRWTIGIGIVCAVATRMVRNRTVF